MQTQSFIGNDERPGQMYDFFGFPDAIYEVRYDAPGSPRLAREIAEKVPAIVPLSRKLDHGAWSLLHHIYPKADIPVLQLCLNRRLDPRGHFLVGEKLADWRRQGVLILGSGNVTHNLCAAQPSYEGKADQMGNRFRCLCRPGRGGTCV